MANVVELREMSGDKLTEMLENAREEMFNLRFQKASARLENTARLRQVRREVAQVKTILYMRQLAKDVALEQPAIAEALADERWTATARFNYEDSAWRVEFIDENRNEIATAVVNLNKKGKYGNRKIRNLSGQPNPIVSYEIAG
ncbi:MAG: 50S ribosomal protein L29 [Chloroflexota bacterium]|jgi:large subunit ribosomal protein L29